VTKPPVQAISALAQIIPDREGGAPDPAVRAQVRALRAADRRLLAVLDDDPTGSQAVHDIDVVTMLDPGEYKAALVSGDSCFVLTNSRSLAEPEAVKVNTMVAKDLFAVATERGDTLDLISRSDSTLRGHVWAEVTALDAVRRSCFGRGYDGVLFAPAYLEAGRITAGDIHWAKVGDSFVPVGDTEFARDSTFGFRNSNLRDFVEEVSRGRLRREEVLSLSLDEIRGGGPEHIAETLSSIIDLRFVVVNAVSYADLDAVALGALLAERQGKRFLYRSGPSFVRALNGQEPIPPLTAEQIWGGVAERAGCGHGLVVVGSHVEQTSRQLDALRASTKLAEIVLDVPRLLQLPEGSARLSYLSTLSDRIVEAAAGTDVLLYTTRSLVTGADREESLQIARVVSSAVSQIVRDALRARPNWFVAKGGITSHDVATSALGIRRARVIGQLFPGVVSVFHAMNGDPLAVGRPYVVFAGNVGDTDTLAAVVAQLQRGNPAGPGEAG
jgi:uncharacterized protein YgbK (DUF1537 family)